MSVPISQFQKLNDALLWKPQQNFKMKSTHNGGVHPIGLEPGESLVHVDAEGFCPVLLVKMFAVFRPRNEVDLLLHRKIDPHKLFSPAKEMLHLHVLLANFNGCDLKRQLKKSRSHGQTDCWTGCCYKKISWSSLTFQEASLEIFGEWKKAILRGAKLK